MDAYEKLVWKYPLSTTQVPVGAKPVLVGVQDGRVHVWFEFQKPAHVPLAFMPIKLEFYGTGHIIPQGREHIGSCFDGPYVWHVYKVQEDN